MVSSETSIPERGSSALRDRHEGRDLKGSGFQSRLPLIGVLVLIALFSILPVGRLVMTAIAPTGVPDFAAFHERLAKPSALRALWNTLDTGFFGALLSLAIGAAFTIAIALTDLPGRRVLGFLLILPLTIAPQVTALAWLHMFGPSSTLLNMFGLAPPPGTPNPMLGRGGIIFLFGVQHAPIVFVTLRAGLSRVPASLIEAARASGSGPLRTLGTIVLPLVRPYIVAAGALAFVSCIGNFGIPALLGMSVNYLTLPTLIYQRMVSFGPGVLPDMASLSVLIGLLVVLGTVVQAYALRKGETRYADDRTMRFAMGPWRAPAAAVAWIWIVLTVLVPICALLATALVPSFGVPLNVQTLTFDNFTEVLTRQASTIRAFQNSFAFSALAALILALIAIPATSAMDAMSPRLRRPLQGLVELPYALPGIVLAIACILLFLRPLPLIGSLYGTGAIIVVAYLMRFLALAMKPVATATAQIPRDLGEAAAAAGAGPLRRLLTITAPLVLPAAFAGALLVFMSAFNELTVSALLWSSGNETLGVVLFSLEEAGLGTHAAAIAVLTIVAVVIILGLLDRFARRLPPGVLPWR